MGSSCSSGPKKKDKGSRKSEHNGAGNSHRGSNASNASIYVYQKTTGPENELVKAEKAASTAPTQASSVSAPAPLTSVSTEYKHPVERSDSHLATPMSPLSPTQLLRQASKELDLENRCGPPSLNSLPEIVQRLLTGDITHFNEDVVEIQREICLIACTVSSDTVEERKAWMESVIPKIRTHCVQRGFELKYLDTDCGLNTIGDDYIEDFFLKNLGHLVEKNIPCVPLIFVNETVGTVSPPKSISLNDWNEMKINPEDKDLLSTAYSLDENEQSPAYIFHIKENIAEKTSWNESVVQALSRSMNDSLKQVLIKTSLERLISTVCGCQSLSKYAICMSRKFFGSILNSQADEDDRERTMAAYMCLTDTLHETQFIQFRLKSRETSDPEYVQYVEDLCAQLIPLLVTKINLAIETVEANFVYKSYLGVDKRLFNELTHQFKMVHELVKVSKSFPQSWSSVVDFIKSYLQGDSLSPLIIQGEEGIGKTWLAAKTVEMCPQWLADSHVVFRFVGLTPDSSSEEQVLRSVVEQCCHLLNEYPSRGLQELWKEGHLPSVLERVSVDQPLVIIVDGVDGLEPFGAQRLQKLKWIPRKLSQNVKLIVTVRSGSEAEKELSSKFEESEEKTESEVYIKTLPRLSSSDACSVVEAILNSRKRTLSSVQKESRTEIFKDGSTPLVSSLVAHHIISLSSSSSLTLKKEPSDLLSSLLEKCELEFGTNVVAKAFGSLAAAKHGLSSSEIIKLCGDSKDPHLTTMWWIGLRERLHPFIIRRTVGERSLLKWVSRTWKNAVLERYPLKDIGLTNLENLFSNKNPDLSEHIDRRWLDELPRIRWLLSSESNQEEFAKKYLLDTTWVVEKIAGSEVFQFLEDLDLLLKCSSTSHKLVEELVLLRNFILLSANALSYDGRQLPTQLYGRLVQFFNSEESRSNYSGLFALFKMASRPPWSTLLPLQDSAGLIGIDEISKTPDTVSPPASLTPTPDEEEKPLNQAEAEPASEDFISSLHRVKDSLWFVASLSPSRGEIHVWDALHLKPVRSLHGVCQPRDLKFIDDHRVVVLCSRELKIYDLDEGKCVTKLKGVMNQKMAYYGLHDADHVVALSRNRMYVNMMNLTSGDCVSTFKVGEDRFLNSLLVSANGRVCVCGDETQKPFPLLVWDLTSRKLLYDLRIPHHEFVTSLSAITSDGHYVVCVCKEVNDPLPNFIVVYDLQNGTLFKKWKPDTSTCSVAISSEGGCVVSGHTDTLLLIWELTTGACRFTLSGHSAPVTHIRLDGEGSTCITLDIRGRDRSIRMWDIAKGICLASFTSDSQVTCCELTPHGRALMIGVRGRSTIATLMLCKPGQSRELSIIEAEKEHNCFGNPENEGKVVNLTE